MERSRRFGVSTLTASPIRVVRIIARLNVGGPSIQAITLTRHLGALGYATTLCRGTEEELEGNMDHMARELRVEPTFVPSLKRSPGWHDLRALMSLFVIIMRARPQIVHTHAAKAGTVGRVAALLAGSVRGRRPRIVHTFHGHSLTGYFSPRLANLYRWIETRLARHTDTLIAVSEEVKSELVALGVASAERFQVIPLGFDLSQFGLDDDARRTARREVREELRIDEDALVVTLVARLVPIKRVDRFLNAAAMLGDIDCVHFIIVGDGELGDTLRSSAPARKLGARVTWTGFRYDIPRVCFASDLVALSSDNEGTPVSLIEASAAGVPTVSTRTGGVSAVILEGVTGLLVERDDGDDLANALRRLLADPARRQEMGRSGREHALRTFGIDRLVNDIDGLYRGLLGAPVRVVA